MTIFRPISDFSVSSNGGVLLSGRGFWGSGGNFLACGLPWECENRLKWSKWPQKLQKSEKRVSKSCFSQKLLLDSWWVAVIYRGVGAAQGAPHLPDSGFERLLQFSDCCWSISMGTMAAPLWGFAEWALCGHFNSMGTVTAWIRMGFLCVSWWLLLTTLLQCGERCYSASSGKFLLLNSAWSSYSKALCL